MHAHWEHVQPTQKHNLLLINLRLVLQLLAITINHVRLRMHVLFCVIMNLHVQDIIKNGYEASLPAEAGCGTVCNDKTDCQTKCNADVNCKGCILYGLLHTISHVQYEHVYNLNRLLTFLHFKLPQLV